MNELLMSLSLFVCVFVFALAKQRGVIDRWEMLLPLMLLLLFLSAKMLLLSVSPWAVVTDTLVTLLSPACQSIDRGEQ